MLGYYADHNTYAGATVAKLREYDDATSKLPDITIAWATPKEFCLETGAGSNGTYHLRGPAEAPKPGACPSTP